MQSIVILFHKPYGVLSQFTRAGSWQSLADFGPFPPGVYAAGRLDVDSEGLLVLTDDRSLKRRLTEPRFRHPRTYLVQVERVPGEDALRRLQDGVVIEGKKTLPATVRLLPSEPDLPPRATPIRFRRNVPTAWLELTITEGRNRQVRKMTAAVGFPTLRLVRTKVGKWSLTGLPPGGSRRLDQSEIENLQNNLPEGV